MKPKKRNKKVSDLSARQVEPLQKKDNDFEYIVRLKSDEIVVNRILTIPIVDLIDLGNFCFRKIWFSQYFKSNMDF